jgi:hypothetical protein
MKKLFTLISILVLGLNYSKGQIRLNEISPANNGANKQFIEFFAPAGTISNFKVLIWYSNSATDWGFYVLSLTGSIPTTPTKYFVIGYDNTSATKWTNTSSVYKVKFDGTTQNIVATTKDATHELNNILKSDNRVFLVKGTEIVDVFASGYSSPSTAQLDINTWSAFTPSEPALNGFSVIFNGVLLTSYNTPAQAAGNGSSFSYFYANGCNTTTFPWEKESITRGAINTRQNNTTSLEPATNTFYWDDNYYTYGLATRSGGMSTLTTTGQIPDNSLAFDYVNGSPTKFYFKYVMTNTNLQDFTTNNGNPPSLNIYFDSSSTGKPNLAFDPTIDGAVTFSQTFSSTSAEVNFAISNEMFYMDGSVRKLRPFFIIFQKGCYSSVFKFQSAQIFNLPVTLKYFATKTIANRNEINWITSSESNNKGFEIQRSIGNTNDFKTIGFVGTRAKDGNSQTEISYSFEDADVKAGQTHYYRLNQIDFDGKSTFSPVRSVKPGSIESNLNVYPNPSQGSVTVNTGSASGKLNIYVLDNSGRVVNQYINVSTSNTRISNLKKGFYTLKIVNTESGEQSAQRVVVQ